MNRAFESSFNLLAHSQIGHGSAREVFTSLILPDCVIKTETKQHSFQNVMEWETWHMVKGTPAEKHFAPCEFISPDGIVLIQARTTQPSLKQYPEMMPVFLCDFKRANYGMYKGKLVCHDYGINLAMHHSVFTKKTRKAHWNDNL